MKFKKFVKVMVEEYPDLYFDYSDGVDVSENEIKKFISKGIKKVRKHLLKKKKKKSAFYTISTGNVKILIEIYRQKDKENLFTVWISITKNYSETWFMDVKL